MLKRMLSVLCSVLLLGVVGVATAQYGGGGGGGGSGGMSHRAATSSPDTSTNLVADVAGAAAQAAPRPSSAGGPVTWRSPGGGRPVPSPRAPWDTPLAYRHRSTS